MSPASYLAAPPRVATHSIAAVRSYDPAMPWWTWVGIGVFAAAVVFGSTIVLLRIAVLSKTSGSLQRKLEVLGGRLAASTDDLERRGTSFGAGQDRVKHSVGQLRGSIARLQVLVAALEEIRLALRLVRAVRTDR